MKKFLIPMISFCIIFGISACTNNNSGLESNDENFMNPNEEINDRETKIHYEQQSNESDLLNDHDLPDGYLGKDISQFEELPTINQYINLDKLAAELESDIPNKRVILFKNNNTNALVYKSIYIKDDQHLKIVELAKDHLIFNSKINE